MFHDDDEDPNIDEFGDTLPKSIFQCEPRHGYTIQLECKPKYYISLTKQEWRQLTLFLEIHGECRNLHPTTYAHLPESCRIVIDDWTAARTKKRKWADLPKTPNELLKDL